MKNNVSLILWIVGFIFLNLYSNAIPKLVQLDVVLWLGYAFGFFAVALLLGRYILNQRGLSSFGLEAQEGWFKLMSLGFVIGFSVWALKYLVFYGAGKFEIAGWNDKGYILGMLAQALLGMLLAAAMNDVLIRGYWLAFCRKNDLMKWHIVLTTFLYAMDDSWNEGFDVINLIFSAVLGISLAYTVIKTGTIWMAIGIHWGSNMMFRAMAGFDGRGLWKLEQVKDGVMYEWISILATALLFPVVYLLLRRRRETLSQQKGYGSPEQGHLIEKMN
ncbi:MAG: CPBP family intramembrane metalloprotease [Hymenobacteraceae bacterium]|nr:CPBP family intramembrane metalloprotease [Hymenobacteraceae bacterium]MDX5480702.1 CPBP family intramembrane metalloprotease [Hymenobacteraceae bacterium]